MPPLRRRHIRGSRAELAIALYLAHADQYAVALTHKAERDAATFLATGVPSNGIGTDWAHLKADETAARLRAYRQQLREVAKRGGYDGPTELTRLGPDGTWEPLHLPGD